MLQLAEATSRAFSLLEADALERLAAKAEACRDGCAVEDVDALRGVRDVLELQLQAARRSIALRTRLLASSNADDGIAFTPGRDPWVR